MRTTRKLIHLRGRFNRDMVKSFKQQARKIFADHQEKAAPLNFVIRVNSRGGNIFIMNVLSAFVYYLAKYRKCTFVIQIEQAQSAALIFALNIPVREATIASVALIHLPVPAPGEVPSGDAIDVKQKQAIQFIGERTKLSHDQVAEFNNVLIHGKQLVEYGIATTIVEAFEP